jgi:small subunit ribosomal protein S14
MAKKSMIQRELKRQKLVMKYATKRATLKKQINETTFLKEKLA